MINDLFNALRFGIYEGYQQFLRKRWIRRNAMKHADPFERTK